MKQKMRNLEGLTENERLDELIENFYYETSRDAAIVSNN